MILFPAIDLKDGACVRLKEGVMDTATVFNTDPAAQARAFVEAGARWLHVVDLNGAFEGRSVNADAVRAIRDAVDVPIQLGGGIRTREAVETWLEAGITRVILGTIAARNPPLVRELAGAFENKIVVGIDAKAGYVAVEGWAEASELGAPELASRFEDAGVAAIVYTDIDRDGLLKGINIDATARLADKVSLPLIASGGLKGIEDIEALKALAHPNIAGVIAGRALYDGRLDIRQALDVLG